jgi:hypothetical protein
VTGLTDAMRSDFRLM